MAEANGNGNSTFEKTVASLMKGVDGFVSSKTVVGEPIFIDGTILLPLVDVTFGMGAGAFIGEKKKNSGGGVGAKISPNAVLVIRDGVTRMVTVKGNDAISKILDMIPDFVNKFMDRMEDRKNPEQARARAKAREEAAEDLKGKLNLDDA